MTRQMDVDMAPNWARIESSWRTIRAASWLLMGWVTLFTFTSAGNHVSWRIGGVSGIGGYAGLVTCIGVLAVSLLALEASRLTRTATAWLTAEKRHCCTLAERAADLERQRHEFFNELTVLSVLLQMKAPDRAQSYLQRILATYKDEAGRETAAARLPGTTEAEVGFPATIDLSPVFGTLVALKRRARENGVRFHIRVNLDNVALYTPDPYLPQALAHLTDYALDAVQEAEPGRREIDVELTWAPDEESLEVWSSAPPADSRLLHSDFLSDTTPAGRGVAVNYLGEVRRWATQRGGRFEMKRPARGGTSFRLVFPVRGSSSRGSTHRGSC